MKNSTKKGLILSLCMGVAFSVVAGIQSSGYEYVSADASAVARQDGLTVDGFSVRVNVSEEDTTGEGVRFHVGMTNTLYESLLNTEKTAFREGVTTGTVVVSSYALGNAELTKDTDNAIVVDTTEKWNVVKDGQGQTIGMQSIVYVWDIPSTEYGTDIAVVGYINDNGVITYSDQEARSMSWVAKDEYDDENSTFDSEMKAKLKASYIDKKVTLHNGNETEEKTLSYGDILSVEEPTVSAGYTFDGWYNEAGTAKWDMTKQVTNPMNLYAKITANTDTKYYVNVNKDGVDATAELAESLGLTENTENGKYYLTGTTDTTADITALVTEKCPNGYVFTDTKPVSGTIAGDESLSLTVDYWSKAANEFAAFSTQAKLDELVKARPTVVGEDAARVVTSTLYTGTVGGVQGNYAKIQHSQTSMHTGYGPELEIYSMNSANELMAAGYTHIVVGFYLEEATASRKVHLGAPNGADTEELGKAIKGEWLTIKLALSDVKTFVDTNGALKLYVFNGGSASYCPITVYMSEIHAVKDITNDVLYHPNEPTILNLMGGSWYANPADTATFGTANGNSSNVYSKTRYAVDISAYRGKYLKVMLPVWSSDYGLFFLDENGNAMTEGATQGTAHADNADVRDGSYTIAYVKVPETAQSVHLTWWSVTWNNGNGGLRDNSSFDWKIFELLVTDTNNVF